MQAINTPSLTSSSSEIRESMFAFSEFHTTTPAPADSLSVEYLQPLRNFFSEGPESEDQIHKAHTAMATSALATESPSAANGDNGTKTYACVNCVQRKVKCDKRQPCFSCFRSGLSCKYRSTPPSQRRKRKAWAVDERFNRPANQMLLLEKLRSHEAALRNAGIPHDSFLNDWNANDTTDEHGDEDSGPESTPDKHVQEHPVPIRVAHQAQAGQRSASPFRGNRGLLLPEYGGKRYYDHGFMGAMGQEVSNLIIKI